MEVMFHLEEENQKINSFALLDHTEIWGKKHTHITHTYLQTGTCEKKGI